MVEKLFSKPNSKILQVLTIAKKVFLSFSAGRVIQPLPNLKNHLKDITLSDRSVATEKQLVSNYRLLVQHQSIYYSNKNNSMCLRWEGDVSAINDGIMKLI